MKSWPRLFPTLVVLLFCTACGDHSEPASPSPASPKVFEFKSEDGKFSVLTPVDLSPTPFRMDSSLGPIHGHLYSGHGLVGQQNVHQFLAGYLVFPINLDRLSSEQLTALLQVGPWNHFLGGFQFNPSSGKLDAPPADGLLANNLFVKQPVPPPLDLAPFQPNPILGQDNPGQRDFFGSGKDPTANLELLNHFCFSGNCVYFLAVNAPIGQLDASTAGSFLHSLKLLRSAN